MSIRFQIISHLVNLIPAIQLPPCQHDKEKMLKNPHPLGLEVKIAEQEQVLAEIVVK